MQVGCPSCGTKYVLPPQMARPGVKARCKRCGALFATMPDKPGPEATASESVPSSVADPPGDAATAALPSSIGWDQRAGAAVAFEPGRGSPWAGVDEGDRGSVDSVSDSLDFGAVQEREDDSQGLFGELAPPPTVDAHEPPARAVGLSAIRAQSLRSDAVGPPPPMDEEPSSRQGWLIRLEDKGDVISFRDLVSVRAWMNANADTRVMLSSDGLAWCRPDEILDLVGDLGEARKAARATTGRSARVTSVETHRSSRAGPAWITAVGISTVSLLLVAALTVHNLGLMDLAGVLPFETLGMRRLVWSSEGATGVRIFDLAPEERYGAAVMRGNAAKASGRLMDAAVAYELALESREGREALEGLSEIYRELGDGTRAGEIDRRLNDLGEDGGVSPPRDG